MNRRSKGMRIERLAEKILLKENYLVYRVRGSTKFQKNQDIFNSFDILALDKNGWVRFIQVKSNKPISKSKWTKIIKKRFPLTEYISYEYWNHKDRVGWDVTVI